MRILFSTTTESKYSGGHDVNMFPEIIDFQDKSKGIVSQTSFPLLKTNSVA